MNTSITSSLSVFRAGFAAVALTAALAGCAGFPTTSVDDADRSITADVESQMFARSDLEPIGVQTVHGVVYLSGVVESNHEREDAETAALEASHGAHVVNAIGVSNRW